MTTLSHVELGVLGPLQVRQYGLPVAVPGAKPRAVLTMLGLHGGAVVTADALAELLWGARPPRTAVKALQTHISSLRRALGEGYVLTEGTGWTLSTTEVDATRYKLAARLGREAFAGGDAGQAVARFDEALALWRGAPELPDGPRGGAEKTRWIEGHAALVEDRADALLATGRAAEIVGELEAAIADAPLRERRWGQLMLALYRAGRQGESLGAYQRARSMLADELGVDPGPDLRRLEAAIVAQDIALEIAVPEQLSVVTRAVTFLLTDIEGSTAAWEADAEAMATALARHDEIVEQVVTSRGGRLVKTRGEGDATFSVFDRPSGASAAAIELQEAIRHEPWVLAEPMRIRVALHTGEVELRDGDYFGRAVNRAARLRSLAEGGQILCSGATAELVIDTLSDDVVLADLGMRQLRNLARPEHVFELRLETAVGPATPMTEAPPMERPDLPAVLAGPGPFVGRAPELERLLSAWQLTLDAGTRAVLIAGEPGVGKTRLSGEWSRQAYGQGAVVLYGRCDEDLGAPYQPFAEALRSLVPCLGASRLRGLRGVEALLALVPGLTDVLPDLTAPPRADADTERYALFDAVVALLGIASASAPVVLVLDDLHWAAKPTLLLLRHLLRFGEHARVQIVGTYRSTDLDRSHPLAAMLADLHRDGSANRLQLSGLDEDDVTAYVAEAGYDDEELGRALASVTGGNPFFLIEALRHVDESGGHWDPSTLPQGVREAVSRRLSRLPAETNKALAAAAVVGSRFAIDLVERVVGEDLVDAFDEASKAGIVIEEPGGRYRFNHAIVRQSLLAELASVRRMRLHQRIASTLESEQGADDELLAELAYHYFECAWAGNAVKAVDYCRRAADQAMARLAYEGAADLYDKALHALDELDDELPDRADLQAELLVARCEALLAAGDVGSARGAVSQLQGAANDSARLAAWGTCFDGQLSMLTDPERLDEIESEVSGAAQRLAELDDAAGEANAHTVRAACLARLGRIADSETALDQALTAARRARDHRRVNAVLAGAPLAALWGPNPVPRAGGRCLDVVRLLRITTGSPVVEATSTRCQGVLDAMRGRAAAGRQLIDSARRTLTELGMRHALLEVDQFAGIVELVADDPAAAEPHLRRAYVGFRRMGLDADTAETAAFLARTCLALDRDAEADELCRESERLAGHALRPSITWRTVRAQLHARVGAYDEARRVAGEAVSIAERTDALVDHGDACLTLAMVLAMAGDTVGSRAAAEQAVALFERKGAAALVERARSLLGTDTSTVSSAPEVVTVEPENDCVRTLRRVEAAVARKAWSEVEQAHAEVSSIESRRKIVGFERMILPASRMASGAEKFIRDMRAVRTRRPIVAIRGERLALTRTVAGTADDTPEAPLDEMLQLVGIDEDGRIALQIWFDIDDMDAAIAELDAVHSRFAEEPESLCVRAVRAVAGAVGREAWDEVEQLLAPATSVESRRKLVGFERVHSSSRTWPKELRRYLKDLAIVDYTVVAVRGEQFSLIKLDTRAEDPSPGAPQDEVLELVGVDEEGRIALQVWFDPEDFDAAMAELDAVYIPIDAQRPQLRRLENRASQLDRHINDLFADRRWNDISALHVDDVRVDDRRRGLGHQDSGRDAAVAEMKTIADLGVTAIATDVMATRGEHLVLARIRGEGSGSAAFFAELLRIAEIDSEGRVVAYVGFDLDDVDAAFAELDARYLAGEAAPHVHSWSVVVGVFDALNRHELPGATPDWVSIDHRRGTPLAQTDLKAVVTNLNELTPDLRSYVEAVHLLGDRGAVFTQVSRGTSPDGFDAEWRILNLLTVDGDMVNRCELFDESELDSALTRLDELSRPAHRLDNAANRVLESYLSHYAARDWDLMSPSLADDFSADDRRRVVNSGIRHGRDNEITNLKAMVELGVADITTEPVAIRGERLVLARHSFIAPDWLNFDTVTVDVVEIDANNKIVAEILFEADDLDSAIAELDARYLAGEAAERAGTWSVISRGFDAVDRREIPAMAPDFVDIDYRQVARIGSGDLKAYLSAAFDDLVDNYLYVESVHRLTGVGAVVTHVAKGTSQDGLHVEWRLIDVVTIDRDLINRIEMFDEADVDAALARFDELSRPAPLLENAASRVTDRYLQLFTERDWDTLAAVLADDFMATDRRRVVNAETRHGRDADIAVLRATADLGLTTYTSKVIANRGDRLALSRIYIYGEAEQPEAFHLEFLAVGEINADELALARVIFDPDDLYGAFAELDARYLEGEAAAYGQAWSVVTQNIAAFNRHEFPASTPDFVNVDHRRVTAFASGDMTAYVRETWEQTPDLKIYIESVHRLNDVCAVFTYVATGTSQQGFAAEWRAISASIIDGDLIKRSERFDEADLDAALARFDELTRPPTRLQNTASRVEARAQALIAASEWDAMSEVLADDVSIDDRRRVVNAGLRRGRDAVVEDLRVGAEIGLTHIAPRAIAIRGERLTLRHIRYSGGEERPEAGVIDLVQIVEIDADERITALVLFDADDLNAALAELDARYVEGEAAPHARTWSVIADGCVALNQQQLPDTPGFVYIDRRRVAGMGAGDMRAFFRAVWEVTPNLMSIIEAVHRLSDVGAVVSQVAQGTSDDGFYAEWRVVNVFAVDGEHVSRCEVFDETDLDTAITRFDELSALPPQPQNAASRSMARFQEVLGTRDWDGMAEIFAEDICLYDRRPVVGVEFLGRDATIANMRASADTGVKNVTSTVVATRGGRLALHRVLINGRDERPEAFRTEALVIGEVDAQNRTTAFVMFDLDDLDAAFNELDARYLAGEGAANAQTYSVIADAFAAVNRHELPTTTTTDFVSVDHRRPIAFAPGEMMAYLQATLNDAPEIRIDIVTVHRLNSRGVVVSHAWHNTSQQGFDAEWRVISISMLEGGRINRCELFDETDLDAALARFDELSRPTTRLESAASRVAERFRASFAARDWNAMAEMLAENLYSEDRRTVVNAGIRHGRDSMLEDMRSAADIGVPELMSTDIATRGERLVLVRAEARYDVSPGAFYVENLAIAEIDADERVTAQVQFDLDDLDAAFKELDARYLTGEAAPHAHTWTVIAEAFAAMNRRELPATTRDWVTIDRRRLSMIESSHRDEYLSAAIDVTQFGVHVEAVHRLGDAAAVVTWQGRWTTPDGFDAEWRGVSVLTCEGDLINRCELFDEKDLDEALVRFDDLSRPVLKLQTAASKLSVRFRASFATRDWDAMAELLADDLHYEDRRRVVNAGIRHGRDSMLDDMRSTADMGISEFTTTEIATRGERLVLVRAESCYDVQPGAFYVENLAIAEIDADERMTAQVMFDLDEADAAFAELDARYLVQLTPGCAHTWSVIADSFTRINRRDLPESARDVVFIDHSHVTKMAPGDLRANILTGWDVVPDLHIHIETVHRITDVGAVLTWVATGTSREGFEAEWRSINVQIINGEIPIRVELFDEKDLDEALARFDELCRPANQLENAASRAYDRFKSRFAAREWDAISDMLTDDHCSDDRRRVVGAGIRHGREAEIQDLQGVAAAFASMTMTSVVVAIRGERLALCRGHFSGHDQQADALHWDLLGIIEVDADERIAAFVTFEPGDIEAAFEELDARYLAGEAADHARTWSAVAKTHSTYNRYGRVPDDEWVSIDHRRGYPADKLTTTIRAARDLTPDLSIYIEAVHRLSDRAAVITNKSFGTSHDGFAAEWRMVQLMTVDGDHVTHLEIFDESDVDVALAKFDELTGLPQQLNNAASHVIKRIRALFAARDWSGMRENLAETFLLEDRRRIVNGGTSHGRDTTILDLRAAVDVGFTDLAEDVVALRGERLVLTRARYSGNESLPEPYFAEVLHILEIDADQKLVATTVFDPEDTDAAFAELDARYMTGEADAYARTWSLISRAYVALNRHEIPPTTPDWVNVDRRHAAAFDDGGFFAFVRAAWDVAPNMHRSIETVHRLSNLGAVVTHTGDGTSQAGFEAEWRSVVVVTFDGDLINHLELFDENDLDAAIMRFDELSHPARRPQNAASQVAERFWVHFAANDRAVICEIMDNDISIEDRRPVVNSGLRQGRDAVIDDMQLRADSGVRQTTPSVIATRGGHLVLGRIGYSAEDERPDPFVIEILFIIEIDASGAVLALVVFDPDAIDTAFEELDSRYAAGEADAHANTWSVIVQTFAAFNRHEQLTTDWAFFDHRRHSPFAPSVLAASMHAVRDLTPDLRTYLDAVHRLSAQGAVVTNTSYGTSPEGFDAEWQMIQLFTVDSDRINRCELFDEDAVDAAIARLDELSRPTSQLENAATRVDERFLACFASHTWEALSEIIAVDASTDDRRRLLGAGVRHGRDAVIEDLRVGAGMGVTHITPTIFATRGERLTLRRTRYWGPDQTPEAFLIDVLHIIEIDADDRIAAIVTFDPDDLDTAFVELDTRYLAGEAAAHAHTWSLIAEAHAAFNRREHPGRPAALIDHRPLVALETGDPAANIAALWAFTPNLRIYPAAVHRLSELGAVITQVSHGTSQAGFEAEWRVIQVYTVEGDLVDRCEMFEEADIDAALARFDELSPPVTLVENAASQATERLVASFAARDWTAMAEILADDVSGDDRRRG